MHERYISNCSQSSGFEGCRSDDACVRQHFRLSDFPMNLSFFPHCSQLHVERPEIPDVPAIYFVSPTIENIRRIIVDLENVVYDSFYLNFVEPLSRALLEELAVAVARDGIGDLIEQVSLFL